MKETHLYKENELEIQLRNGHFVLQTQKQLIKDFAKFNLFFPETFEHAPQMKEHLEEHIAYLLLDLLHEGERRLLQLLYTIDIPEKEFLQLVTSNAFLPTLSKKILLREAYKVFLRSKFSS